MFGDGPADHFGATIDNVRLKISNYIAYENFESAEIPAGDQQWTITDNLPGWQVQQGEVGYSNYYNPSWHNNPTKVIELDAFGYNADYKT